MASSKSSHHTTVNIQHSFLRTPQKKTLLSLVLAVPYQEYNIFTQPVPQISQSNNSYPPAKILNYFSYFQTVAPTRLTVPFPWVYLNLLI